MKDKIINNLHQFIDASFTTNALELFNLLGYDTSITITQSDKTYKCFKENFVDNSPNKERFNELKALSNDWKSIDFLFQLADNLSGIKGGKVDNQIINSVVFACIELTAPTYSRTQLAEITRQVNLVFAMPVVVLFKYNNCITLSVIHRRINKKDEQKDVLEKVSLIKDISLTNPHRAQLEILHDFAFPNLANKKNPTHFVELTHAWETVFNTKALNKQFFKKIANWYFLSVAYSKFPYDYLKSDPIHKDKSKDELQEIANQKATIRFITRMIFVWFLKEKGLISEDLFNKNKVTKLLKKFNKKNSSDYYNAILQNLFFATLNKAKEHREFALNKSFHENKANHDVNSLYRYESMFQDENPENIMKLFENIPFLNGGLFDSLDNKENNEIIDGFSRKEKNQAKMPDFLFFEDQELDFDEALRAIYDTKKGHYEVKGLFEIFNEYKFTIEENTPTETDVALDPYLLGEIFENLLAYYNPETGTTARKGSGSFYTPQEIVNYMVDESLKAYLDTKLSFDVRYELLHDLDKAQKTALVQALSDVKILDPACGSGAFPMGVLYKMVDLLKHIDPDNSIWKQIQHDKIIGDKIAELEADKKAIEGLSDKQVKEKAAKAVEDRLNELETIFNNEYNFDDYARKLYIIQNCIYGVDIQDVAIQISKLRFFLSLIVDQKNEDIKPLPNLETKFVIANTLIGIDLPKFIVMGEDDHSQDTTKALKEELKQVREHHFKAVTRKEKLAIKEQDKAIREKIANSLADVANTKNIFEIEEQQKQIEKLKTELSKANDLPETEEIETGTLFETKKEITFPRKNKIAEINRSIKNCENKIDSLQTNTQAELIRAQALKIAQWDIYNQNAQADWFDMDWMFGIQDGFDIVIGNPPYVNVEKLDDFTKKYLFEKYENCKGRTDLYIAFIEKSLELLKQNGINSFIIPYAITNQNYGSVLRKNLLEKYFISEIVDTSEYMVFDTAIVKNVILNIQKTKNREKTKIKIVKSENDFKEGIFNENIINQQLFLSLKDFRFETKDISKLINLKDKIYNNTVRLDEICLIAYGARLNHKNEKIGKDNYIHKDFKKGYKPFTEGKNIDKYVFTQNAWLNYQPNIHYNSMFPELFENEKIFFINVVKDKLRFAYDNENYYNSHTVINAVKWNLLKNASHVTVKRNISSEKINLSLNFNYLFLICILNSNLINWYFVNFLSESLHFYPEDAKELPIKEIPLPAQQPFIKLVDKIIDLKKAHKDTSELEHEIDVMVYHLYGLNYDEACVIDDGLSAADFEKYRI